MTTITLKYDKEYDVWKATGADAKVVFNAIGLYDPDLIAEKRPAIISPYYLDKFKTRMRENYNIEVITIK